MQFKNRNENHTFFQNNILYNLIHTLCYKYYTTQFSPKYIDC